jgi:hypothetical protein
MELYCAGDGYHDEEGPTGGPVKQPSNEARARARACPGGYVYEIDSAFGPFSEADDIPPQAIVGAWKVSNAGDIRGGFVPNENYKPRD